VSAADPAIGVVVIGRNEGERLRRCLRSLGAQATSCVYVDSGSSDDSVSFARSVGAQVVELDPAQPFTAARARNEGAAALARTGRDVEFVQFVDGDCEIEAGWLAAAAAALRADAGLAVVFGRRREREREASVYNRLCDLEWDVPPGEVLSCGGDALMRRAAFDAVGGFDPARIAGEEPELCLRLRGRGWRIRRIDAPMTVHDAAMHRFGQWWRRAQRGGYVDAEGVAELGRGYPRWRAVPSVLLWTLVLPSLFVSGVAVAAFASGPKLAALTAVAFGQLYLVQWWRIRARASASWSAADASLYATWCMRAKWPCLHGMATWCWRRVRGGRRRLIEYKGPAG
jgi:GT2 family glycosyltransferase